MISFSLFIISGGTLATLLVAKRYQEKKKKTFFILSAISKSDERARELHHKSLHHYSRGKEQIIFLVTKQLPLKSRIWLNKALAYLQENLNKYMWDIRNSKLLKRDEGISEFFKNISEIEKGGGQIDEVYEERESTVVTEVAEPIKKSRASRRKKVVVVESE